MSIFRIHKNIFKYEKYRKKTLLRLYCECVPKTDCVRPVVNPQNLPLLPIPKLGNTIGKLVNSAEPLASQCELVDFRDMCTKFLKYDGPVLQEYLIHRARSTDNWVDRWYREYAYLSYRDPIPMTSSPVVVFPRQKFSERCHQLDYTARIILGALEFRKLIRKKRLPLETRGKYPLDMSSYHYLFSNYRMPRALCDEVFHHCNSKHIIVMIRNNLFGVKVLNDSDRPLSYGQLMQRLEEIAKIGHLKGDPFGILTTMRRDKWALLYNHLEELPDNAEYLDILTKALFVVCLDEALPKNVCSDSEPILDATLNGFHGHGPKLNGGNRWYDKTLQFFITRDGASGIIFEHSPIDAIPIGTMADFLINYTRTTKWLDLPFIDMCDRPLQLNFITSPFLECEMKEASNDLQDRIDNFHCEIHQYDKYGTRFCKDSDLSPDGIIQLALQLAYFKLHGEFTPQRESATTRMFYLGRNDAIRSCTCEFVRFIKHLNDPLFFVSDKFEALSNALRKHRQLADDAMEGRGIDCHLFGLLIASKEMEKPIPKLYRNKLFQKTAKFRIASRQHSMKSNTYSCYPLGHSGGYAVSYNPRAEDINICVTCTRKGCFLNSRKFLEAWISSMKIISDIICADTRRKKKLCD